MLLVVQTVSRIFRSACGTIRSTDWAPADGVQASTASAATRSADEHLSPIRMTGGSVVWGPSGAGHDSRTPQGAPGGAPQGARRLTLIRAAGRLRSLDGPSGVLRSGSRSDATRAGRF